MAPVESCSYKSNLPWFDNDVFDKMKDRDKAYKIFRLANVNEKQIGGKRLSFVGTQ